MTTQEITELMHKGYQLRNHGYGWHLYPPGKPVGKVLPVPEAVVDEMVFIGIITVSLPYKSCVATLTAKGDAV